MGIANCVPVEDPWKAICPDVVLTIIVKSDEILVPPLSLITFLIIVREAGGGVILKSSFVMVQVRSSPSSSVIVPLSDAGHLSSPVKVFRPFIKRPSFIFC